MYDWAPYVPMATRRANAAKEVQKLAKKGRVISPVEIAGRQIATTFWGKAWCENLERYSDYANRLPRGRTYVRNGSVLDLQIHPGRIEALVSGSHLYTVVIEVKPLPKASWTAIRKDCAGAVESLVELLQGRLSKGVMERICQKGTGLFPAPSEISLSCSCPDWAGMCKHVAAVLYGIGARLDTQPELLFSLRGVDEKELITEAAAGLPLTQKAGTSDRIMAGDDLGDLFGLDMAEDAPVAGKKAKASPVKKQAAEKAAAKPKRPAKPKPAPTPKVQAKPKGASKAQPLSAPSTPKKAPVRKATASAKKPRTKKGVLD